MKRQSETYKHYIPEIKLSIERNTGNVPKDGKFYVVKEGEIVKSFKSRKIAEELFQKLVSESGFKPNKEHDGKIDPMTEASERYAMEKDIFWAEGPKYKGKGGRGGRGGV